jgi:hypothetical protein
MSRYNGVDILKDASWEEDISNRCFILTYRYQMMIFT